MLSNKIGRVTFGGPVPGQSEFIDTEPPYIYRFRIWKYSDEEFSFIDLSDAVNLRYLVTAFYTKVSRIGKTIINDFAFIGDPRAGARARLNYARYWGNQIITQFADAEVLRSGQLIADLDQNSNVIVMIDFNLQIRWRDLQNPRLGPGAKPPLNTHWLSAFPSYMDSEGTGYILLDRDNNLDGPIQNVNLTLREDENFVKDQIEFTNIPLFSRTLFVRPKMVKELKDKSRDRDRYCRERKCRKRCHCHSKPQPIQIQMTTTSDLEYMVNTIYQNVKDVKQKYISPSIGEKTVKELVESYKRYQTPGTNLAFSYINTAEGPRVSLCGRYNLESSTDCIVAFTMCPVENEIILKVSNSTIDSDMRDAVYPYIIPFGYQLSE